jgi:hypothetical protein
LSSFFSNTLFSTLYEKRKLLYPLFTDGYRGFMVIPVGSQTKVHFERSGLFLFKTRLKFISISGENKKAQTLRSKVDFCLVRAPVREYALA